jgi:hypothetical protein
METCRLPRAQKWYNYGIKKGVDLCFENSGQPYHIDYTLIFVTKRKNS